MTASGQLSCPPPGSQIAVTGQFPVAAVTDVWTPAYNADGHPREGAWLAELTGLVDLTGWPQGMRVISGKERPHPGAQLRFTDTDGLRLTAFITNTRGKQLADLELRIAAAPAARTASASARTPD
jgi:hypothetical protein